MRKLFLYGGWVVAVMLLFCCGVLMNKYFTAKKALESGDIATVAFSPEENKELSLETKIFHAKVALAFVEKMLAACESGEALEDYSPLTSETTYGLSPDGTTMAEQEQELAETEKALAEAESMLEACRLANPLEATTEFKVIMLDLDDKSLSEEKLVELEAELDVGDSSTDSLPRSERTTRVHLEVIGGMVDLLYQDFFEELGLSPEKLGSLKTAIAANMLKQQKIVVAAWKSNDRPANSVYAEREALRGELREALRSILSAEKWAIIDAHKGGLEQILLEKTAEGALEIFAAGLSDGSNRLASQIIAEELTREINIFNQSDELFTRDGHNAAQARGLNAALERLKEALADDQLALVDAYVTHELHNFDALSDKEEGE